MASAKRITNKLLKRYPDPRLALEFTKPLELLVAVMLSAQCTDARVNQVTRELFKKYRTAQDYANADRATFEQEIRSTGFYKNKAKAVINCAKGLLEHFDGHVPKDPQKLATLPGVGRKTANMVVGNAFGVAAIAVDTHVLRVSNRLGLAGSDKPDEVEGALMEQIPRSKWTALSNAMILHGRETCTARKPKCCECVLYRDCEWRDKPECD